MIIPVDNPFAITVMSTGSWMMALFYVTTADGFKSNSHGRPSLHRKYYINLPGKQQKR